MGEKWKERVVEDRASNGKKVEGSMRMERKESSRKGEEWKGRKVEGKERIRKEGT